MNRILIWVFLISFFFLLHTTRSDEMDVKTVLLKFMVKLSTIGEIPDPDWGWNSSSDPCRNNWKGVICDNRTFKVQRLFLDGLNFPGTFDPSIICSVPTLAESLNVISLNDNRLHAEDLVEISSCKYLTRLHLRGNRFSGNLPDSLSRLNNLKILEISNNQFSGVLPDLARISELAEFLAQNNQLSGAIPNFDFSKFRRFNVSTNDFTGPIPDRGSCFPDSSFLNNPKLCGDPLPNKCRSAPVAPFTPQDPQEKKKSKSGVSRDQILMFLGYFAIGLVVVLLIMFKFCRKGKKTQEMVIDTSKKVAAVDESNMKPPNYVLNEYECVARTSGVSVASVESGGVVSSSMVVLTSPKVNGLKFEDLLTVPAELLGRGKHGSVYKVICEDQGMNLAVKRIKDWTILSDVFKQRMKRLDQVRHPNVLPPIAFYCSKQEKLIVYEYQPNGSLFKLLHGDQMNQTFDWSSRLGLAATIAKALAFMHQELQEDGISHGNLKSSNILLNQNMEPCISEYGLMVKNQELSIISSLNSFLATQERDDQGPFKSDIYEFGVILLEMLTGKLAAVQNNGMDLVKWALSVVREEWTVEVFNRGLIREGASEERMVNLLQIAIKCVHSSPEARPNINQVVRMINTIKERMRDPWMFLKL